MLFIEKGQLDEAEKIYLNLLESSQNDYSILQLLGTIYLQKKKYNLSEEYLLKSLKLNPENEGTLNNLGILNKALNNIDKSIKYFETNIKKNNFLNSWVNKSNILVEKQRNIEGLEFSKLAHKNYSNDKKLKNNYALFLFECGFKDALKIYEDLIIKNYI